MPTAQSGAPWETMMANRQSDEQASFALSLARSGARADAFRQAFTYGGSTTRLQVGGHSQTDSQERGYGGGGQSGGQGSGCPGAGCRGYGGGPRRPFVPPPSKTPNPPPVPSGGGGGGGGGGAPSAPAAPAATAATGNSYLGIIAVIAIAVGLWWYFSKHKAEFHEVLKDLHVEGIEKL